VHIPDANFKTYLVGNKHINTNGDKEITFAEAETFTGTIDVANKNISDLTGIEKFINITFLNCNHNSLTTLDISKNTALENLSCTHNQLNNLDLNKNINLKKLECKKNKLTFLDLNNNTKLVSLVCDQNQLNNLKVGNNKELTLIDCSNNKLTSLDISANLNLKGLYSGKNNLTSLDIKTNTKLKGIRCDNNNLTSLDIRNTTNLTELKCNDNYLICLNLKNGNNKNLSLDLRNNKLDCITVDNASFSNEKWSYLKDETASFSESCAALIIEINQEFIENQTLADLRINGQNLIYYSDKELTKKLEITTKIIHNAIYYAKKESKNCQYEILAIKVIVKPTEHHFNEGQTLADLVKNGENISWYADAEMTIALSADTKVEHNKTYYAKSKNANSEYEIFAIKTQHCDLPTPTAETIQSFIDGQTIENLKVDGEHLVWYSDKNLTEKLEKTTKLEHNTTYYVRSESETCQSDVLEITVTEATVNRLDFDLYRFSFYPNPVIDVLYFSSNAPIEKVVVSNMLGQQVNVKVSSDKTNLYLSNLSKGSYLVKVTINSISKTYKIIKK